jgi:hypothetical protein
MNNEPVAWIDEINTFVLDKDYQQFPKSLQHGMIPLYTHPVKELTDEEIKQAKLESWQQCKDTTDVIDFELSYQDELFARAILRKAQE